MAKQNNNQSFAGETQQNEKTKESVQKETEKKAKEIAWEETKEKDLPKYHNLGNTIYIRRNNCFLWPENIFMVGRDGKKQCFS